MQFSTTSLIFAAIMLQLAAARVILGGPNMGNQVGADDEVDPLVWLITDPAPQVGKQ
ncbi:hypothetical protein C8J57DRAFT_1501732 [Mycena rebaudengoi]|nr:hypothetical protein C8J57DRAFT_1501732 [Mycena rebaudengoi]